MNKLELIKRLRDFRSEVADFSSLQKLMNDAADLLDGKYNYVLEFDSELVTYNGYGTKTLKEMFKNRMEYFPESNHMIWNYGRNAPDEQEEDIGVFVEYDYNNKTLALVDYDGIFLLPKQAITLLEQCGVHVGVDFR